MRPIVVCTAVAVRASKSDAPRRTVSSHVAPCLAMTDKAAAPMVNARIRLVVKKDANAMLLRPSAANRDRIIGMFQV